MSAQWGPDIERWWAEGLTSGEIADLLGTTPSAVRQEMCVMRARGVELAHRSSKGLQVCYEPATYETADAVDPYALIEWLESHEGALDGAEKERGTLARNFNRWRNGAVPSFHTVDHVLVQLGFHIAELPDDVWLKTKRIAVGRAAA